MDVNEKLIDNLAELARLEFSVTEKVEIKKDLQRMIAFIDKLNELDTAGVEPQLSMSEEVDVLREDVPGGTVSRNEALRNAPMTDGVYFKVPKIIANRHDERKKPGENL
ncbi:MAG TPA: Asp-tRNA(Asn)/Glu-tRNA(Gln) amidotransferase subunit GatC [Puia sp.]|nr:Asp-tRNA(Asn)/Glu-tRNA(Gln) amidotransferase subunit GatC [Puia sp.]